MKSAVVFALLLFPCLGSGQERSQDDQPHIVPKNLPQLPDQAKPSQQGESSSKDSEISPGDTRTSSRGSGSDASDVQEMHPYDPHKAAKDVEVGEYYLKRKNYRAALDRFNEALLYKPNDAEATIRLAQTQEKLELYLLAYQNYENYLNIFKDGPFAKDAQEAIRRIEPHLPATDAQGQSASAVAEVIKQGEEALAKNDFESAHESFVKAVEIAPDDPVANFRLAESLQGLQRLDEARIFYKKYLSLQPNGKMASDAKREVARINYILGKS